MSLEVAIDDPVRGEFRVLGPIQVHGPLGLAALVGARQRAVLGVLALNARRVVPFTRLVDALWGEDPPRTAIKTLHSHVARIRQALLACGLPAVLLTRDPGYLLDVADSVVDANLFEDLVRAGRRELAAGAPDRAAVELRAAMALWRGDAFADVPMTGWGAREVERLHELRLSAVEDLWDAEIHSGGHESAVSELPRLLASHPTRERLTGLHMLALYRCGRHTDALDAYQRLRRRLADEFGVDPGPDLVTLHTSILRHDPALSGEPVPAVPATLPAPVLVAVPVAVPAQIPARVGHFTGRTDELTDLDQVLDGDDLPIVVISGSAGMGKTALAVQWAHQVAARVPEGQLFLDLRGHEPDRALTGGQALAHVLRALDVPDDRIPAGEDERAALYRTLLHGRRCVIVLDNVGNVADVLPLVPTGTNLLVVTSRRTLAALAARHAVHQVALDALDHADSVTLLTKVLGARRVTAEPDAAASLAERCGGMPLALRIAAARLVGQPGHSIAELVTELAGASGLDGLAVEGDSRTVRAVLTSAYLPLDPLSARMFRRLGTAPGLTVHASLGDALCDAPAALDELVAAHLITEVGPDRYRFHDLIREYAAGCAVDDDPGEITGRLLDWYLQVAHEANLVVNPDRDLVKPTLRYPQPSVPFTADRHAALAFLEGERDNLVAVVRYALAGRELESAWQLTYLLTSFYEATGHWHERIDMCLAGVAAATELGDPLAEAEMSRALGVAYYMTRRLTEAIAANRAALRVVEASGDVAGQGHVYNNLANAHAELREFPAAIEAHELAVDRCTAAGSRLGRALSQRNQGRTYIRMGSPELSLGPLAEALATFREIGNSRLVAGTLDTIGEAHARGGRYDLALREFDAALALCREIGDRWQEWEILLDAGVALVASGDFPAAVDRLSAALVVCREVGDRHGEATVLNLLGRACLRAGDLDQASARLTMAVTVRSRVPDGFEEAHLHRDLGELASARGDSAAAVGHWSRSIRLYQQANATAEADAVARLLPGS